ncbi:hypothetical protein Pelo_8098 [Pelomyxa schiedti]|nr:hypothetical protein Pelo_8098 [Pelomyxa schiedti]
MDPQARGSFTICNKRHKPTPLFTVENENTSFKQGSNEILKIDKSKKTTVFQSKEEKDHVNCNSKTSDGLTADGILQSDELTQKEEGCQVEVIPSRKPPEEPAGSSLAENQSQQNVDSDYQGVKIETVAAANNTEDFPFSKNLTYAPPFLSEGEYCQYSAATTNSTQTESTHIKRKSRKEIMDHYVQLEAEENRAAQLDEYLTQLMGPLAKKNRVKHSSGDESENVAEDEKEYEDEDEDEDDDDDDEWNENEDYRTRSWPGCSDYGSDYSADWKNTEDEDNPDDEC